MPSETVLLHGGVVAKRTGEGLLVSVAVPDVPDESVVLKGRVVALGALMGLGLVGVAAADMQIEIAFLGRRERAKLAAVGALLGMLGPDVDDQALLPTGGEVAMAAGVRLRHFGVQVPHVAGEVALLGGPVVTVAALKGALIGVLAAEVVQEMAPPIGGVVAMFAIVNPLALEVLLPVMRAEIALVAGAEVAFGAPEELLVQVVQRAPNVRPGGHLERQW